MNIKKGITIMVDKARGRGRPLKYKTDAERNAAAKVSRAKFKKTRDNIGISKAMRKRLDIVKEKEEGRLGFKITYLQFFTMLLTRYENDER